MLRKETIPLVYSPKSKPSKMTKPKQPSSSPKAGSDYTSFLYQMVVLDDSKMKKPHYPKNIGDQEPTKPVFP